MNENATIAELENVSIRFGRTLALDKVSLELKSGQIVGLLGANGSGKSTLLRTFVGLYLPITGTCQTFGRPSCELGPAELARIGYVHQEGELLDWMKAGQMIRYVSEYYPNWNRELEARYVRDFDIDLTSRIGKLSPGQRQRLAILLAICFEPQLLILDEPAAALDPLARSQFLDLLLGIIQDSGRTVVISSHILSDVEKVIDHVTILQRGQLVRDCGFDELQEEFCRVRLTALQGRLPDSFPFPNIVDTRRNGVQAVLTIQNPNPDRLEQAAGELNCQLEFQPLALDDLYKLVVTEREYHK